MRDASENRRWPPQETLQVDSTITAEEEEEEEEEEVSDDLLVAPEAGRAQDPTRDPDRGTIVDLVVAPITVVPRMVASAVVVVEMVEAASEEEEVTVVEEAEVEEASAISEEESVIGIIFIWACRRLCLVNP